MVRVPVLHGLHEDDGIGQQPDTFPDPERGDRVEGEALLQVAGLVEAAVLDARAILGRVEEALDLPAQLASAQRRRRGLRGPPPAGFLTLDGPSEGGSGPFPKQAALNHSTESDDNWRRLICMATRFV